MGIEKNTGYWVRFGYQLGTGRSRARGVGVGYHNFSFIDLDDLRSKKISRPEMIV